MSRRKLFQRSQSKSFVTNEAITCYLKSYPLTDLYDVHVKVTLFVPKDISFAMLLNVCYVHM